MNPLPELILASGSRHRRKLLERLGLTFQVIAPEIDETARPGEAAGDLVRRLALSKAETVAATRTGAVVIGADQVAECGQQVLGKPGDRDTAAKQLHELSGRRVRYRNGLAVITPDGNVDVETYTIRVRMRTLDGGAIDRYLDREKPYDCAGSLKSESYGITLVETIESDDPTALVGLSLIRLCALLRKAGYPLP